MQFGPRTLFLFVLLLATPVASWWLMFKPLDQYTARRRKRTVAVQWLSRRTADLMHLPDGPEIAPRDALFAGLYSELAWIHSHDTQDDAEHPSPIGAASGPT